MVLLVFAFALVLVVGPVSYNEGLLEPGLD